MWVPLHTKVLEKLSVINRNSVMKPILGSFLKKIPFSYFLFLNTLLLTLIL